jgi:uncharacterized membrane protein
MVSLGFVPGHASSKAHGVSADGSVVVGRSGEAFRWTAVGGMVSLGPLTRGGVADVSADGSTVVGDRARDVYRWMAETGAVILGSRPGTSRTTAG